jgi:hypothetical protein
MAVAIDSTRCFRPSKLRCQSGEIIYFKVSWRPRSDVETCCPPDRSERAQLLPIWNIGAIPGVTERDIARRCQRAWYDSKPTPIPHSTFVSLPLSPTMRVLKALAASSFFVVSSLAASASDWRGRSIYQVSRVCCLSFPALMPTVTSFSQIASHLRMDLVQPVVQMTANIVVATTEAS